MSNFTFGHNVVKSRLLLLRQNAYAGGKQLIPINPPDVAGACLNRCKTVKVSNQTLRWHRLIWDRTCPIDF